MRRSKQRYEKINDLYNEMSKKIETASESIKSEYQEEIEKLKNGE